MAINNRQSPAGTIIHSEQVARYTDGRVPDVPRTPTSSPRWGPSASATTTPPSSRSEGGLIWAQRAGGSDVRAVDTASVTPTAVRIRRWVGRATRCRCRRCRPCRQAHVVDDRQIVEVARDHRSGRVADRRLGRNDCRPSCHHVFDTDVVHVLPVRRSGCLVPAGWRLVMMRTASRWLRRPPAASACEKRSAPNFSRIRATMSPPALRGASGHGRSPARRRKPSAAPNNSAARSASPSARATVANAARDKVTLRVLWTASPCSTALSSCARASSSRPCRAAKLHAGGCDESCIVEPVG